MSLIINHLRGIFSIDWSKKIANVCGFLCAIGVYILWPLIPFPSLHFIAYSVDLVGTLLSASACAAAAIFMLGRGGWKAAGSLANYLTYALLVATVLIAISIAFSVRTIVVQGGINLDIVLLFVALVAFMGVVGARGFWGLFFKLFFLIGIPLLFVDLYFGFAIYVSFQIPYDSLILGGGGLSDGLNKMFFMVLAFALAFNVLTRNLRKGDAEGRKNCGPDETGKDMSAPPVIDASPLIEKSAEGEGAGTSLEEKKADS
jgi:hypothetical protein